MKFSIIFATIFLGTFYGTVAHAEPIITEMHEGDPAPYSGILYNTEAQARLLAKIEADKESCKLEEETSLRRQEAEFQHKLDVLQLSYDSLEYRTTAQIDLRDENIEHLTEMLEKSKKSPIPPFLVGVLVGTGAVLGGAWAIKQVGQ